MTPLFHSNLVRNLVSRLVGRYLWLILRTNRWTLHGAEHIAPQVAGTPALISFWHEQLPLMPALAMISRRSRGYRSAPLYTLVSHHRDGRFIGAVVRRFGIEPVFGSSSRGGAASLRQMRRLLQDGAIIAITPDGPRGPRRQAAEGVGLLAAMTGVPIVPVAARTTRRVLLRKTWDQMAIPLPFGRGVVVCGPPILVPRDAWTEGMPAITAAMNAVVTRADQLCGRQ